MKRGVPFGWDARDVSAPALRSVTFAPARDKFAEDSSFVRSWYLEGSPPAPFTLVQWVTGHLLHNL